MGKSGPIDVLCIYRVKAGNEAAFAKLLQQHGPALSSAGLSGPELPKSWKATTRDGKTVFVERMQWKDQSAADAAHQMPEVMAVWEPMGTFADSMEFLHLEPTGF